MITDNLQQRCIALANLDPETYKSFWTKWITAVDKNKDSGFAFDGEFFENESIKLAPDPALILFAASTTQNGYPIRKGYRYVYEHHEVMIVSPQGELESTGLVTQDDKRWAVALRDQVAMLLSKINQIYGEATALQLAADHLFNRLLAVRLAQPQQWDQTDATMIQIVLDELEKQRHTAISQSLNTSERVIT